MIEVRLNITFSLKILNKILSLIYCSTSTLSSDARLLLILETSQYPSAFLSNQLGVLLFTFQLHLFKFCLETDEAYPKHGKQTDQDNAMMHISKAIYFILLSRSFYL